MPKLILTLTLFVTLATTQTAFADGITLGFNPSQLMDPSLDDQMVDLAIMPDRGERALTRIIESIEEEDGQFTPRLYAYLLELGQIKQANQAHREAIDVFQRMQTLTHWADGVYSPLQLESIRLQSRSYEALGRLKDADRLEQFHLRVAEKSAKRDSDLVAPIWRLANWQRASLQYREALKNYERALQIIDAENMGPNYKIQMLKAKALAEHLARSCCADETLLALADLSEHDQYSDTLDRRAAKLNAADMLNIRGRQDAIQHYQGLAQAPAAILGLRDQGEVFEAFDRAESPMDYASGKEVIHVKSSPSFKIGGHQELISAFSSGDPVRLCTADANVFRDAPDNFVDVSIEISPEGRPSNIELSGTAPLKLKRYLRSTLVKSAYRPAIENGVAQTTVLTFRQHFNKARPLKSTSVEDWRGILTEHACQLVAAR